MLKIESGDSRGLTVTGTGHEIKSFRIKGDWKGGRGFVFLKKHDKEI